MSGTKKRRIVICSILKPIDDTRMYEKMAISLAHTNRYEISIIGFPSRTAIKHPNITFLCFKRFNRLSISRLLAPWKYLKLFFTIKPAIIIFTTHELLLQAVLTKVFLGCAILYDVQENYYRNILYTSTFPVLLRPVLACYTRVKEMCFAPFITCFILAEAGYAKEINFIERKKKIVLENKICRPPGTTTCNRNAADGSIQLLFSGTLSETTGVFHAIKLVNALHTVEPKIRLTIIGYCAQPNTLLKIKKETDHVDFIQCIGGDALVPHPEILNAIQQSDFGIISYPPNKAIENAIPTKLYEYLGYNLPILLTQHPDWINLCSPYPACIPVNFEKPTIEDILFKMKTMSFYTTLPDDVFWEEERFITLLDQFR